MDAVLAASCLTELQVPEHRNVAVELALRGGHMSLLDSGGLGLWFANAIGQGLPKACVVVPGLRKTGAHVGGGFG